MSQCPPSSRGTKYFLPIFLIVAAITLSSCSTFDGMFSKITFGEEEDPKGLPPETLIVQGMDAYNVGNYSAANRAFKTILDEHPFSAQAMLAELKAADAYYYNKQYTEAKTLYKEFEERHPTNEAIPYVMFQIGMCDFRGIDRIDRDTSGAENAIKSFTRLLHAYPQSPYAREAQAKIRNAKEFLVNHEYYVAVFYVRTDHYNEAKHRLKYLLAIYPDAAIAPQAKTLLEHLEAGKKPSWGMGKWLPEFMTKAPADRKDGETEGSNSTLPNKNGAGPMDSQ